MNALTRQHLRNRAISNSLFPPTSLDEAIKRLSFVQADPIRAPAAAQDLILRHRVKSYHNGDLDRQFACLNLEEDLLYAYGFMTTEISRLLHPRKLHPRTNTRLSELEAEVLTKVQEQGHTHPRDLDSHFGRERVKNDWGGYSQATKRALEGLHDRGLLRVVRRENGVRVYEPAPPVMQDLSPELRFEKLILAMARIFEPAPVKTFQTTIATSRRRLLGFASPRNQIDQLLKAGKLEDGLVDGVRYIWLPASESPEVVPRVVRFLAPFDPLVWDRFRFEQFWGWAYRFEAYTPKPKRVRGYYAMPLLFGDSVIGWAEVEKKESQWDVKLGFIGKRPRGPEFKAALESEIADMERFLSVTSDALE